MMLRPNEYESILRSDLTSFVERSFYEINRSTEFLPAPYIEVVTTRLEAVRHGDIKRLIIDLPPRLGKSHTTSVAFPAWWLGHHPGATIMCLSYGQDHLAEKFARECRQIMMSEWYQRLFRTRLSERQAVMDFMTTEGGGRYSTSLGAIVTGRGADLMIIDDPLKPEDALSEPLRSGVNSWFDSTAVTRFNNQNDARIIIVMQRLHQNDLVGHVLKK